MEAEGAGMSELFSMDGYGSAFVVAAGRGRALYFTGTGFTIYRNRARIYRSEDEARSAMCVAAQGYKRPNLRVIKYTMETS